MTKLMIYETLIASVKNKMRYPQPGGLVTRPGQKLFFQGDPSDSVYLLISGVVVLQTVSTLSENGMLSLICRGTSIIGDRDVLLDVPAREMAQCLGPCELVVYSAAQFKEELEKDAGLREVLSLDLCRRYARTLDLQLLNQRPLPVRLYAALRDLSAIEGMKMPETADLAFLLGASEKSIRRGIQSLNEWGIDIEKGQFPDDLEIEALEDVKNVSWVHRLELS